VLQKLGAPAARYGPYSGKKRPPPAENPIPRKVSKDLEKYVEKIVKDHPEAFNPAHTLISNMFIPWEKEAMEGKEVEVMEYMLAAYAEARHFVDVLPIASGSENAMLYAACCPPERANKLRDLLFTIGGADVDCRGNVGPNVDDDIFLKIWKKFRNRRKQI
jgi:hypothetical protein